MKTEDDKGNDVADWIKKQLSKPLEYVDKIKQGTIASEKQRLTP